MIPIVPQPDPAGHCGDVTSMLKSRQQAMDELRCALDAAVVLGIEGDEIKQMLAERVKYQEDEQASRNGTSAVDAETGDLRVRPRRRTGWTDQPARRRQEVRDPGANLAVHGCALGKLPRCGRVRAKAPGGGYILTKENQIEYCRDHPRKRGPKPKTSNAGLGTQTER